MRDTSLILISFILLISLPLWTPQDDRMPSPNFILIETPIETAPTTRPSTASEKRDTLTFTAGRHSQPDQPTGSGSVTLLEQGHILIDDQAGFRKLFAVEGGGPSCTLLTVEKRQGTDEDTPFVYTAQQGARIQDNKTIKQSLKDSIHGWGCDEEAFAETGACSSTSGEYRVCVEYPAMDNISSASPTCATAWIGNTALDVTPPADAAEYLCHRNRWTPCVKHHDRTIKVNGTVYSCASGSNDWRITRQPEPVQKRWQIVRNPVDAVNTVHAIDLHTADFGFALAHQPFHAHNVTGTTLYRWDGTDWKRERHLADVRLHDIQILDQDEAWAVGNNGTIMRWDGTDWHRFQTGIDGRLFAIDMVDTGFGMAAGGRNLPNAAFHPRRNTNASARNATVGVVLQWNGKTWQQVTEARGKNDNFWMDVEVLDRRNAWITGGGEIEGGERGRILHWDGTDWEVQRVWPRNELPTHEGTIFPPEAHTISATATDNVWVMGDLLSHWNGTAWRRYPWNRMPSYSGQRLPDHPEPIYTSTAADDSVFIGGQIMPIMQWRDNEWQVMQTEKVRIPTERNIEPPYYNIIWSISMLNESYGMAGGTYGKIYMYRGD